MREYDRTVLLERVEREGATVGTEMPDEVTHDGESVPVRATVLEFLAEDGLDEDQRERLGTLVRTLRRARRRRVDRIDRGEVSRETGEALADEVAGIDRALNALERIDDPAIEELIERTHTADRKRWMQFLRQALGHDDDQPR